MPLPMAMERLRQQTSKGNEPGEARIKECDETLARFRTVALDPVTTPSALMAEAGTVMQHLADLRACLADPEE